MRPVHLLLPLVLWAAGCGPSASPRMPSFVLITIDTLRADHCSCYGYPRKTTPRLDALAGEGARFETAYSPLPTTGPTHSTLFTSLHPIVHGVTKNGYVLDESVTTMAELFKTRGYSTAAFVSSYALDGKFGFAQGFDHYDDDFSDASSSVKLKKWEGMDIRGTNFDRRANETTDKAMEWLEAHDRDEPFFLWVHYFDPHQPFDPPEEYLDLFPPKKTPEEMGGYNVSPYDGEIRFADHEMGRLVDYIDERRADKPPLIIVTSDHGEGLMQHRHLGHGLYVYEEAVRVPLIVRWKGKAAAGRVFEDLVEISDIMPTAFSLLGLPLGKNRIQGKDLAPILLEDQSSPYARPILTQRRYYESEHFRGRRIKGMKYGLRDGDWKFIHAEMEGTEELYNLREDPHELENLAGREPKRKDGLKQKLNLMVSSLKKHALSRKQVVSDEDNERFNTMGYIK